MLELNDFIWRVAQHTAGRLKVFLYTAPGLAASLRSALSKRGIQARVLSRGVVVVYAAQSIAEVLRGVTPQAHREPLSSALDRYERAWKPLAKFRKASAAERRECQRATEQCCQALKLAYEKPAGVAWDD
jgi:hypothetical protein